MIIVQTPLRVSLFGGGTDFPSYFLAEGGCVLTSAVDKYIFVAIKQRFDAKLRVGYTQTEIVDRVDEIQHELIREAFRTTGILSGVEITTMGDIPAGSGLGSSGAVTVGALHAMYAFKNELVSAEQLAREACQIEIDQLKKPVGIQDQYIAAYGGLRFIQFNASGSVECERIHLAPELDQRLNESLLLFFTGVTRSASSILDEQNSNIQNHLPILRRLKEMAVVASKELQSGNLDSLGHLLHESWQLKKQLASGVSNPSIEVIYQRAQEAGALGGKITGAGGGGFFLVYCKPQYRQQVREALSDLRELPFTLEPNGSSVIFNHRH
jgi:D-glycero-alpha-D-manno-heptose-7-phosphate kinase